MRRAMLDILAIRTRAQSVADEITSLIRDDELRPAFQQGTRTLLAPIATS